MLVAGMQSLHVVEVLETNRGYNTCIHLKPFGSKLTKPSHAGLSKRGTWLVHKTDKKRLP